MGRALAAHTPAIVVALVAYGESDRIVRLLTPDRGRVSALARRARGSQKRFGGALDVGNRIEAGLRPGRGDLDHLDDARLVDGRLGARRDLTNIATLAYCCELVGALSREHQAEPRLFGLLDMALVLLDGATEPPKSAFLLGVEAKALTYAGYAPVLTTCTACGEAIREPIAFDPSRGGAAHLSCAPGGHRVDERWLEAAERARRTPLRELIDADLPPGPHEALAEAIEGILGRALKSRSVLRALAG